ncbi:glycosyltransferase [Streptomyces sp. SAJ15]|uniref:glycosyltransferase n=1 Tax=Streptomyces sp. SAJ15 TaxID=2011095 RepID=UPI001186A4D2|nr:glycosyltransferase family 4 protein [Streptomyces sp. SAJ15]TVL88660.1 hypothetical protein CD790_30510 [Streptomyces sp. SAJ15]
MLAFDIPCLRDLVTDDVGVRVPSGDVDAYAEALVTRAGDPARCAAGLTQTWLQLPSNKHVLTERQC